MLAHLFQEICKAVPLHAGDKALCTAYFEEASFNRNMLLDEQGKKTPYLYFVHAGFMRLFYHDGNGDEVTTYLASPGGFICSFLSFIHDKPAAENVECITGCRLLRISRPNLASLIDKSENFKKFSLVIFEQVIAFSQIRANDLATLTAELRYKKMMNEQPQLLQHVPVQYVASFLGIKPQSLSRIRRSVIL